MIIQYLQYLNHKAFLQVIWSRILRRRILYFCWLYSLGRRDPGADRGPNLRHSGHLL